MEFYDLTTSEAMRILLENQSRELRSLTQRIESLHDVGAQAVQSVRWRGTARAAHDDLVDRLLAQLGRASTAVDVAAEESARAVATLAGRVG